MIINVLFTFLKLITSCNRLGTFQVPLGVDDLITGKSILSSSLFSLEFTSLGSFEYDEIIYVFAGTAGSIEQASLTFSLTLLSIIKPYFFQFFYRNESLVHIQSLTTTVSANVVEIHVSEDKDFYYFLTDSTVSHKMVY